MVKAHYINPGNALFDCLIDTVRDSFRDEMLKGTVLVSPEDKHPYFAFFVKIRYRTILNTKWRAQHF